MTSKKLRVTLNDELQSLVDNSKTTPAVLIAKLVTDMLAHKYDKRVDDLMKRRTTLMSKINQKIMNDVGPGRLGHYWDQGAAITVDFGIPSTFQRAACGNYAVLLDYFKSLDNCAPLSAASGMARIMNISMFKQGPAIKWAASLLFQDAYADSALGKHTKAFLTEHGLSKGEFVFGLAGNKISLTNPKPTPRVLHGATTYETGGSLNTFLKNVDLTLFEKMETLALMEAALAKSLYDDIILLAQQTSKIRNLGRLLRKMPDMLEHPELKTLLGFNVNPQAERVAFITNTLSGAALLTPTM